MSAEPVLRCQYAGKTESGPKVSASVSFPASSMTLALEYITKTGIDKESHWKLLRAEDDIRYAQEAG
jgi:hypothetical protein